VGERIFLAGTRAFAASLLAVALATASFQSHAESKGKPAAKAEPQVPWGRVASPEQKILVPLEKDWNHLSGTQQRRLMSTAKQYPKFAPIQQERFQERIKEWAALTPAQREAAREKYQNLSKLPPAKQHELREKWGEKKAAAAIEPSSAAELPK